MSLNRFVRQLKPIQENKINYVSKVDSIFSEAYTFFPKSEEEISKTLKDFPHENVQAC